MADEIRVDPTALAAAVRTLNVIFINYAGAMCDGQILERYLVWTLMLLRRQSGEFADYGAFTWAFRQVRRDSMKQVLAAIRRHGIRIPPGTMRKLEDAFRARNYLAHEFFQDHNPALPSPSAAARAVRAIAERESLIKKGTEILEPLYKKLMKEIGYDMDDPERWATFHRRVLRQIDEYAGTARPDAGDK
jgi:hypothetical protein